MKNPIYVIALLMLTVFSCEKDELNNETLTIDPSFKSTAESNRAPEATFCHRSKLIADGRDVIGYVEYTGFEDNYVINYVTFEKWEIIETHLNIGNCSNQESLVNENGDPMIDQFEHASNHAEDTYEVTYLINKDSLGKIFCLAAQAKIKGPNGIVTAWADGAYFEGSTLAMYIQSSNEGCRDSQVQPYSKEKVVVE